MHAWELQCRAALLGLQRSPGAPAVTAEQCDTAAPFTPLGMEPWQGVKDEGGSESFH